MQRLHDFLALLFFPFYTCLVLVQEAIQVRVIDENLRTDEIQKSEEFFQTVLEWSACDE